MSFVVGPALWSSKAAILALYIRIFSPTKWLRFASYIGLIAMFFPYWVQIPLTGALCVPQHNQHWDFPPIPRCGKLKIMALIQGAVGIAADCFLLILPLPILRRLQMARSRKAGLFIVFLVGILCLPRACVILAVDSRQCHHCQCRLSILPRCLVERQRPILGLCKHLGLRVS